MIRSLPSLAAAQRRQPSGETVPARVSPTQLPSRQEVTWLMVNLGLATLLGGLLARLLP